MAVSGAAMGQPEKQERGAFGSKLGFILAAVGSAVGLGNIWRFPFSTAENGGAAFLFVYLIILFVVGVPVMFAELSIGRKGKLNPIGTFRKLSNGNPFWIGVGWVFVLTSLFIISWYAVIAGWVLRYVGASMGGTYFDDPAAYFDDIQSGPLALLFHAIVIVITTGALAFGVSKGIERVAFIMMPILLALSVGIAIWVGFLSGAGAGYSFYLQPDFSELDFDSLVDATGQAFFSLSLGQGAILTYASYLDEKESLTENGTIISIADTGVAVLGGLMVFPALAAFGLLAGAEQGGAGALFVSLATAFAGVGVGGQVLGTLFFVALFFAAFTSAISLLEVSISFVIDQWNIHRKKAAVIMGLTAYSMGIVSALNPEIFGLFSGDGTSIIVIAGGLLLSVFAGWVMKDAAEEMDRNGVKGIGNVVIWMLRIPVPIILAGLLVIVTIDYVQSFQAPEVFGWSSE